MNLLLVSIAALVITLAFQQLPGGPVVDVVSPLLVVVGLVAPRKTAIIWTLCMAALWSALVRCPFVMLVAVWGITVWAVGAISREIEWKRSGVIFVIAALVSLGWRVCMLLLAWFDGCVPTMDKYAFGSLLALPITSGVVAEIFQNVLLHAANPRHPALRKR